MQTMIKIMGCILIISASSAIGYLKGMEFQKRLSKLRELRIVLSVMKSEIQYTKAPLTEVFDRIGRRCKKPYDLWLTSLADSLSKKPGTSFGAIWESMIERHLVDSYLKKEDLEKLKELGAHMGYLDEELQIGNINLYLERLGTEINELQQEAALKRRLYNSLGIMGGIFLSVVLI